MKIIKKLWVIFFLCCALAASAQSYKIGDVYTAPDGSRGIVYYLHPDGSGGWVVALNDASTGCTWGASNDVPGLANQNPSYVQRLLNDTAGYANTRALRNYQNNSTTYAAGKVDFAHGWVLPSPAQLSMLYGQLPFIASAITGAGGTALGYNQYWCSAENSASNAWCVDFGTNYYSGYFTYVAKTTSCRVRAVRSFSNTAVVYDTSLTYQWNTGSTQPYINVSPSQTTTYTVTGTTDYGCSTTAEQTIIVGTGSSQTIYDTVCQGAGYEANGFTLTAAQTSTPGTLVRSRTLTTAGCSSTLTLRLMVKSPVAELVEATACGSYTWNGVTYYESGEYTQTFTAANGCDSVVTLQLTLVNPPEVTITATDDTVCEGERVRLYAHLDNPVGVDPVSIGDILCTDGSLVKPSAWPVPGKTALGVVFYVDNTGEHGWAVHLQDQGENIQWCSQSSSDVSSLTNINTARNALMDLDGYSNTMKIRNEGNASMYPAAWLVDFANGWYLPAMGQLRLLVAELSLVNPSLEMTGGSPILTDPCPYYWSSTERNYTYAWCLLSCYQTLTNGMKDFNTGYPQYSVRSVRNF